MLYKLFQIAKDESTFTEEAEKSGSDQINEEEIQKLSLKTWFFKPCTEISIKQYITMKFSCDLYGRTSIAIGTWLEDWRDGRSIRFSSTVGTLLRPTCRARIDLVLIKFLNHAEMVIRVTNNYWSLIWGSNEPSHYSLKSSMTSNLQKK